MASDSVVHAIVEKGTLESYVNAVNSLVDECKLHMSGDGFHVAAVDPANVAFIEHADLAPRAFEAYDAPGSVTQGINLIRLLDFIDPADADQLIDLNLNMESRKLEIRYGQTAHSMALIDPDSVREEPDVSELPLQNRVVIEGKDFSHAVQVTDLVGDHVTIRGDPDSRQVQFTSQGDTDDTTVSFGDEDVIAAEVQAEEESIFSLEYLKDMAAPVPDDTEVTLRFTEEHPIRFTWEGADGAMDVQMLLAPRIQKR